MDRVIIYPGAIPLETDLLQAQKNDMIALSKLAETLMGGRTSVVGLQCIPTAPASLQVQITPGQIYQLANIDATAYSSLAADTAHNILKQGVSLDNVLLNCPAPGVVGQSVNYLIQAQYLEVDDTLVALPYYNASNPAVGYTGPNNSGIAQNTKRRGTVNLSAKAGVAATTGSQTTPTVDAGFVGLWIVTVANGQTTITAPNISMAIGAPYIPNFGLDTGVANAYAATVALPVGFLTPGVVVGFKAAYSNTGVSTFNLNGTGAVTIKNPDGGDLVAGNILAGRLVELQYDGVYWQIVSSMSGINRTGFKNYIINGNFDIWQRGVSSFGLTTSSKYTADRWIAVLGTGAVGDVSQNPFTVGQGLVPNEPAFFLRFNITTQASALGNTFKQYIEDVRSLAGKTVTLSFWAKAGANLSNIIVGCYQHFGTGGAPSATVDTQITTNAQFTNAWQKFTYTFTIPAIAGKTIGSNNNSYLAIYLVLPTGTTYYVDLAQVQLEEGPVATQFECRHPALELFLCQRYYEIVSFTTAQFYTPTSLYFTATFKVPKRGNPSCALPGASIAGSTYNVGSVSGILSDITFVFTSPERCAGYAIFTPTLGTGSAGVSFMLVNSGHEMVADSEL
jgi:hypothetical protein